MKGMILGVIFARGGSKGVPRKNVRSLAGKPLIGYAIEAARASRLIDRVIVSTDDAIIADVARQFGAEVPFMRPAHLAQDESPEWLAWQHAVREIGSQTGEMPEVMVSVPATSPLRSPADIDRCISKLRSSDADLVITVTPSDRNPYFNMVVLDEEDVVRLAIQPEKPYFRRQDAPPTYDITTVAYAVRTAYLLKADSLLQGKTRAVVIAKETALDIDTELDFQFAEFILSRSAQLRSA